MFEIVPFELVVKQLSTVNPLKGSNYILTKSLLVGGATVACAYAGYKLWSYMRKVEEEEEEDDVWYLAPESLQEDDDSDEEDEEEDVWYLAPESLDGVSVDDDGAGGDI